MKLWEVLFILPYLWFGISYANWQELRCSMVCRRTLRTVSLTQYLRNSVAHPSVLMIISHSNLDIFRRASVLNEQSDGNESLMFLALWKNKNRSAKLGRGSVKIEVTSLCTAFCGLAVNLACMKEERKKSCVSNK